MAFLAPIPQDHLAIQPPQQDPSMLDRMLSVFSAPGVDGLIGGPGAVGSLLPGQVVRSGASAQSMAGRALRDAMAKVTKGEREAAGGHELGSYFKTRAKDNANALHDDPHGTLHKFMQRQLEVGRETGVGFEDPTDPIGEVVRKFQGFEPYEIGALLKTHNFARPGFWDRMLTPEKKTELFNWANDQLK